MKDAKGHGSSKRGVQSGGQPMSSNREAAQNFVRALAKTMQPVPQHDSMRSAEADEYNRDLRLRMRNGQVGSGMKFRG